MEDIVKTINDQEAARVTEFILELKEQKKQREFEIKEKTKRIDILQPAVDEFDRLSEEIDELRAAQKEDLKFLGKLIEFTEKASGKPFVYDSPLFTGVPVEN